MTRVLLILPAFNEEKNIRNTVAQIQSYTPPEGVLVDYLVINDGSTDNTEKVCRENGIACLSLLQNLGIGGAVQTGYIYAVKKGYDIAVQFDGDGQHDIHSLDKLLLPIMENRADFVVGSRFLGTGSSFQSTWLRRVGIRWLAFLIRLISGVRLTDVTSGYRAAGKRALRFLASHYPADYPEPESIVSLCRNRFCICEVPVTMFERRYGSSSIRFGKSIYYMLKVSFAIVCAGIAERTVRKETTQEVE